MGGGNVMYTLKNATSCKVLSLIVGKKKNRNRAVILDSGI